MSKLSKTKEYAVKYLYSQNQDIEATAKELKLTVKQVESVVNTADKLVTTKTDKTKDLMIRQTAGKKINSVSIMTQAAAQLSDEFIKNIDVSPNKTDGYIFRPKK